MNNILNTNQPIQVKKVSQLDNYNIYHDNKTDKLFGSYYGVPLDLENSYIHISYPSNDKTIPHNFKMPLSGIMNYCYMTTYSMAIMYDYFNNKINDVFSYINSKHPISDEDMSYISYIHDYWNGVEVGSNIKDLQEYWNFDYYIE